MDPDLIKTIQDLALVLGGAAVTKPVIEKTLTPTAEYVGSSMRSLIERVGNINVLDMLSRAQRRLLESGLDGSRVNERVFKAVVEESSVTSDSLVREYFAAVLCESRSENGADDTALQLAAVIRDMPAKQVRLHYLIYSLMNRYYALADSRDESLSLANRRFHVPAPLIHEHSRLKGREELDVALLSLVKQMLIDVGSGLTYSGGGSNTVRLIASKLGQKLFVTVRDVPNDLVDPEVATLDAISIKGCYDELERDGVPSRDVLDDFAVFDAYKK